MDSFLKVLCFGVDLIRVLLIHSFIHSFVARVVVVVRIGCSSIIDATLLDSS